MSRFLHHIGWNFVKVCCLYLVIFVGIFGLLAGPISIALAQPAYTMNYQGKLATPAGVAVADGTYQIVFRLYTAPTGGVAIWTETRSGVNEVTVDNGLFSVMLGSITPLTSVNFNQPLYLGVTVEADAEMTPRKTIGSVPSAFEAKQLGGVASSSFLRSDLADSASGLLTFTGGLISTASTSFTRATFTTATTTNLVINGERFTDLTGTGLINNNGVLTVSTSSLGLLSASDINTSAELAALLTDETGSGAAVFAASPTFTGTLNAAAATLSSTLTLSGSAANIALGSNFLSGDGGDEGVSVDASGNVFTSNQLRVASGTASLPSITLAGDTDTGFFSTTANVLLFSSNATARFRFTNTGIVSETSNSFTLSSGTTASTPTYTFTNDTDTGIFRATTDVLGFATAATERLRIDASGNVGIGTTTPSQMLAVGATAGSQFLVSSAGVILDGTWQGDVIGDTYLSDTLTIGAGSTFANNIITADSIQNTGQTDEYCLTYESGGSSRFEWQSCGGGLASTDIDLSSELAAIVGDETGSGALVFANSPTLVTPALGTPSAVVLTNGTGLPVSTGISGLGTGVATWLATPSSANLRTVMTDETGNGGGLVFASEPTFIDTGGLGGGSITLGTSGMTLSTDGDGAISFFGLGDGNDENLTLNLDDTANTGVFTSASGLNLLNFSSIGLQESGSNVLSVGDLDTCAEFAALGSLETGTCGSVVLSGSPTITTPTFTTSANFGSAGVRLSDDGDGAITFLGLGNGFDENLSLNFDDFDNKIYASSTTGVREIQFDGITQSVTNFNDYGQYINGYAGIIHTTGSDFQTAQSLSTGVSVTGGSYDVKGQEILVSIDDSGPGLSQVWGSLIQTGIGENTADITYGGQIIAQSNSGTVYGLYVDAAVYGSGSAYAAIFNSGNVGIGTSTPSQALSIGATSTSQFLVSNLGVVTDGTWQGDVISSTYLDAATILSTEIDTSSELAAILGDETGTGNVVFSASPTITGVADFVSGDFSSTLTMSGAAANIALGSNYLSNDGEDEGIFISVTGNTILGYNSPLSAANPTSPGAALSPNLQIQDTGTNASLSVTRWASVNQGSTIVLSKSRGATIGSFTAVQSGDDLGYIGFAGADGTNLNTTAAAILGEVSGSVSSNRVPGQLVFYTAAGSADDDLSEKMRLTSGGNLLIGTQSGSSKLTVAGNINISDVSSSLQIAGVSILYASSTNSSLAVGSGAGNLFNASTQFNTAIGFNAAISVSAATADNSTFIGSFAGSNNTGSYNNFIGTSAGTLNTGSYNEFIGYLAGSNNTGNFNQFIGNGAGVFLESTSSVAIGTEALNGSHATDYISLNNTALGYRAGYASDDGSGNNILIGYQAADNLTTGNNNIIIGYDIDNVTATADNRLNIGNLIFGTGLDGTGTTLASGNIGIGTSSPVSKLSVAGSGYFSGGLNVANNSFAINSSGVVTSSNNLTPNSILTTGQTDEYCLTYEGTGTTFEWQTCGSGGGSLFTDGGANTYLTATGDNLSIGGTGGSARLNVYGDIDVASPASGISFMGTRYLYASSTNDSIYLGEFAGLGQTASNIYNVAIGYGAAQNAVGGNADYGVYVGYEAGYNNSTLFSNFNGYRAGYNNSGTYVNLHGYQAGYGNTGNDVNAYGQNAGQNNTGANNNLFGKQAGQNATGANNNAFGERAGQYAGTGNNFFGLQAGQNVTGSFNVAIGQQVLLGNNGGGTQAPFSISGNIALGYRAGYNATTTADNNILIGYQAADNLTTGNNNIIIGHDIDNITATTDNALNIGNLLFGTGLDGTGTTLSSGNIGIGDTTPDAKLDLSSEQTAGTLIGYALDGIVSTLTGSLTGMDLDLSTAYTATGQSVTGYNTTLPTVTNTGAGTYNYRGLTITGNALTQTTAAGVNTFTGAFITNPNLTQTTGTLSANGVSVTTGTNTTGGTQQGFNVIGQGVGAGTLNGLNFANITGGAGTENAINVGTGYDNILNSTPFDIAGTGQTTLNPLTSFTTGTVFSIGASGATTLSGAFTGLNVNLRNNFIATSQTVTAINAQVPNVANTGGGTYNYNVASFGTSGGTLSQATGAGTNNYRGAYIFTPNITQSAGTVTANGVVVETGTITTGGTQNGINVTAQGVGAGTLNGVNIANITSGAGTENAINIGTGYDTIFNTATLDITGAGAITGATGITSSGTTTLSSLNNAGAILFTDASGVLTQDVVNFIWDNNNNRLGIGDATPDTYLDVEGNAADYVARFFNDGNNENRYGLRVDAGADDGSGTTYYLDAYDGDGTQVGYLANVAGTFGVTDISDIRTKTNITNTDIAVAGDIISQLRVVDFNRIQDPNGPRITGFIAQEVQAVFPYAVTENPKTGYLGIMKDAFVPLLVKGAQEQQVVIAEQGGLLSTLGASLMDTIQSVGDLEAAVQSGLSENYKTDDISIEAGEIVALDTDETATIKRAEAGDRIFGVIATTPGLVLGQSINSAKPVALSGRVPVKVNLEGGDINAGDAITLSSEAGVGTKATTTGRVLGTALEATDESGVIEIFVEPSAFYAPAIEEGLASLFAPIEDNANDTLWGRITTLASNFIDGVLTVAGVKTDELCVGSVCVDEEAFLEMVESAGGSQAPANNGNGEVPPAEEPPAPEGGGGEAPPAEEPPAPEPPPEPAP